MEFIEKNKLVEKNIINNKVFSKVLESDSFNTAFIPEKSTFNNIKNSSPPHRETTSLLRVILLSKEENSVSDATDAQVRFSADSGLGMQMLMKRDSSV